jgi:hypothetical protein
MRGLERSAYRTLQPRETELDLPHFPGPSLTLEVLSNARARYEGLLTTAMAGNAQSAAWETYRPTLARLEEADAIYAMPFLARLQLCDPANWELIDDREAAFPRSEMIEALSSLVTDFQAGFGDGSYYVPIVRGIASYIDGFEQDAFDAFAKVSGQSSFYDVVKDDFSGAACARRLISVRGVQAFRGQAGFPEIVIYHQSSRVDASLLSIAADRLYLRAFAPTWTPVLEALRVHQVGGHFHFMARHEEELALLDELAVWAKANDISCILTYEIVQPADRAYFTIRRFFSAQTVMAATGASLMVLDADLAVPDAREIPGLFARNEGISVAISSGPWQGYLPWRRISGGVVLLPACSPTRRYLQMVTDFIEYFWLANETRHWWVDQLALECARLFSVRQWPDVFFRDFGMSIWDVFIASEDYKLAQLNRLPEVGGATARGQHWNAALRGLQLNG